MTSASLLKRLRYWMAHLGLGGWRIKLLLVNSGEFVQPDQAKSGETLIHPSSLEAEIRIHRQATDPEETLLHECLHLVLHPFSLEAQDCTARLGLEARAMAQQRLRLAEEQAIERLVRALTTEV